jgi:hypothetical protein
VEQEQGKNTKPPRAGMGRPKGSQNKVTRERLEEARVILAGLDTGGNVAGWKQLYQEAYEAKDFAVCFQIRKFLHEQAFGRAAEQSIPAGSSAVRIYAGWLEDPGIKPNELGQTNDSSYVRSRG